MSKKISLESHLNDFFWDPEIFVFVDQAEDFVQGNLVIANIIDNILTIQEFYIVSIRLDVDNAYKKDMLKAVFQNGPHLSNGFVI